MLVRVIGGSLVLLTIELNIEVVAGLLHMYIMDYALWACFMSASLEGMYIVDD